MGEDGTGRGSGNTMIVDDVTRVDEMPIKVPNKKSKYSGPHRIEWPG
jgi:hypothetical protein